MRIVFHENFHAAYTDDPAAARGRLAPAEKLLGQRHTLVSCEPAPVEAIGRVHGTAHIEEVERDRGVYDMALLAAGGALAAARSAAAGQPAFALIRPPGHHASRDSCWGFCFFNNVAVAVAALLHEGAIRSALILDVDLHFGDGTANIFRDRPEVQYLHPEGTSRDVWMENCARAVEDARPADIVAISAGFDRHIADWGETLHTEDYRAVGLLARRFSDAHCGGRAPFAVLEGGYNHDTLAKSALALVEGIDP